MICVLPPLRKPIKMFRIYFLMKSRSCVLAAIKCFSLAVRSFQWLDEWPSNVWRWENIFFRWKIHEPANAFDVGVAFVSMVGKILSNWVESVCNHRVFSFARTAELCFHSFNVFVAHASTYTSSVYTFLFRLNQWKRSIEYILIRHWHPRLGRFCACILRPICASWFQC